MLIFGTVVFAITGQTFPVVFVGSGPIRHTLIIHIH